jgi:hypothetical protein
VEAGAAGAAAVESDFFFAIVWMLLIVFDCLFIGYLMTLILNLRSDNQFVSRCQRLF